MDKKMLADFTASCKRNEKKLLELLKTLELAQLGYELQQAQCDDVYNLVLSEHVFLASQNDRDIKVGDRIFDEKDTYLLSVDDFEKLIKLTSPILVERKITDDKGYFLEDWTTAKVEARQGLIDFIITNLVPVSMRETFWKNRLNYTIGNKLIDSFKNSIKSA